MKRLIVVASMALAVAAHDPQVRARRAAPPPPRRLTAELCQGMSLRNLGPLLTSGRIADVAVDPRNRSVWYVASAAGGVWKTTNRGLSWAPIFDSHGSNSIGCITLDPKNPDVVWLGTGENQSQRSVGFGDGVYKSTDGGTTWKCVGLRQSEHVAKILIDPRNSDVVYVAAQGPLWSPGGDRGLYKSSDGGNTWKPVLQISRDTGVTDVAFDPRNPEVLYAASYQRRRHVGVLIAGGPESAIYRTDDGGAKWTKLARGLPQGDLGRIALAVSPQQPDVVYALVTAKGTKSGFYRSADRGASWGRQSDYNARDPQYYGEIFPDPNKFDRVYAMDVNIHVTDDGGKKFRSAGWKIHVDNHALVFDPKDPDHLLVGNDGGLYETFDRGKNWKHFSNLPVTQFYRVATDNATPFYNVYGGTQDNGTQAGPSRSMSRAGVRTGLWSVVNRGDGMQPRVDPRDPNIAYAMSQNGAIYRLDRKAKTRVSIRPGGKKKEATGRWGWDTPFIISPHQRSRLYLAGSRLYKSDDRGASWKAVSPDLTRQLDRDRIEVMGRVWGPDAIGKHRYTTSYGVATALAESPLKEGLLYVGTDDGLVQVSEAAGKWRKVERFPGVPEMAYVSDLCASRHDSNTVYASFHHYQRGDYRPYLLKSTDRGKTWASIAGDLPARHFVWSVAEDHVNKDLLFVGTEFGLFFTVDGGRHWVQLRGGVPTVAFRDLEMHRREGDLVCATFGRGIYVLDDYTPLRRLTEQTLAKEAVLFQPRNAYRYQERTPTVAAAEGDTTPNPPFGAVFTYYLREGVGSGAKVELTVTDPSGKVIRDIGGPGTAGLHRVAWNLRAELDGPLVKAGTYRVSLAKVVKGGARLLGEAWTFEVVEAGKK